MAETTKKAGAKTTATKTGTKKPIASKATAKKLAAKPVTAKTTATKKPAAATQAPAATAKKPTAKKASAPRTPKMSVTDEQRYRMIAEAAYYRAESCQFKSDPIRDWIEAEKDINTLLSGK
jgi:CRISPR/Cas system-associated protein Cas5 (RAMP superfamily)